jgi:hypothetical protein
VRKILYVIKLKADLAVVSRVSFAKRERSKWGSYRLNLAIANCIEAAILSSDKFDRCILISGQDYPIKSQGEILQFFREHPDIEFIEAFPRDASDATAPGWTPYYRFRRYHIWFGNRRRVLPILRKKLPDFPIFHGSLWWALSRDAVLYLASEFKKSGKVCKFFRSGFLVDEACIQTLMMNSLFADRVSGHDLTFAEWTPTSGAHPKVMKSDDFGALIASPKLFARKFDSEIDSNVLDMLDAVHFRSVEKNKIKLIN